MTFLRTALVALGLVCLHASQSAVAQQLFPPPFDTRILTREGHSFDWLLLGQIDVTTDKQRERDKCSLEQRDSERHVVNQASYDELLRLEEAGFITIDDRRPWYDVVASLPPGITKQLVVALTPKTEKLVLDKPSDFCAMLTFGKCSNDTIYENQVFHRRGDFYRLLRVARQCDFTPEGKQLYEAKFQTTPSPRQKKQYLLKYDILSKDWVPIAWDFGNYDGPFATDHVSSQLPPGD